jgi:hypothetical protein
MVDMLSKVPVVARPKVFRSAMPEPVRRFRRCVWQSGRPVIVKRLQQAHWGEWRSASFAVRRKILYAW